VPESLNHQALLRNMVKWVNDNRKLTGDVALFFDGAVVIGGDRPPEVAGYVPDLFLRHSAQDFALIGEAKTFRDIERPHSREQYVAYMRYLSTFPKHLFLLSVPWLCERQARSLLDLLRRQHGLIAVKIQVLGGPQI
jgi:hypothetical protein